VSTVFDHRRGGTTEDDWAGSGLDRLPLLDPPLADASVLVVAAHPDDETLGAGGLMSDAAARGATVRVLVATDGEASHPHSPTHSPVQLAAMRRAEVAEAVSVVAHGAKVEFLGLPDGALAAHTSALVAAVRERLDGCTLVASPWAGDRHPDHEACAVAVREAAAGRVDVRHWQYPIWAWHWAGPRSSGVDLPWSQLHRLELTETAARAKRLALQCHVSQHSPLSAAGGDEAILPPPLLAHFTRDFETFVVEPRSTAPAGEAGYFDALYAAADDPWGLAERFYERRKRSLLLASLPRPRFRRAFEPGCATGLLTTELLERCDSVVAWDGAAAAVHQARDRVGDRAVVEQCRIPDDWPDGAFDLIVLSEVAYYCVDLDRLAQRVRDSLSSDGVLVACHWRHRALDHPHTARLVHDRLGAGLHSIAAHREHDFLLDVWSVRAESVARVEGIVS
jgi:LmbE family N-acetylglucosaminyl deacetylase/SAM-dependent methyltransferase